MGGIVADAQRSRDLSMKWMLFRRKGFWHLGRQKDNLDYRTRCGYEFVTHPDLTRDETPQDLGPVCATCRKLGVGVFASAQPFEERRGQSR